MQKPFETYEKFWECHGMGWCGLPEQFLEECWAFPDGHPAIQELQVRTQTSYTLHETYSSPRNITVFGGVVSLTNIGPLIL